MAAWEGYWESKSSIALKNKRDNHAILCQSRSCYDRYSNQATLTHDGRLIRQDWSVDKCPMLGPPIIFDGS